jgi:ferredoxin-NADP reductase
LLLGHFIVVEIEAMFLRPLAFAFRGQGLQQHAACVLTLRSARSIHASPQRAERSLPVKAETPTTEQPIRLSSGPKQDWKFVKRLRQFGLFTIAFATGWILENQRKAYFAAKNPTTNEFVKYTLARKEVLSSTCTIFSLRPATKSRIPATVPDAEWSINSVELKQPQLQIVRSYTCLPPSADQPDDELRFLIRREQRGEVSNYVHRLPIGAEVEIRGPHAEYVIPENIESAVFLAGGTGIATALQAADVLDGEAKLHILWASRRREDCIGGLNDTVADTSRWTPWFKSKESARSQVTETDSQPAEKSAVVAQLEALKRSFASSEKKQSRLTVDYFVDEENAFIDPARVKSIIADQTSAAQEPDAGRKTIFVSGPAGFIGHWAGPKQWHQGQEIQGPLGGILSTFQLAGWEVVKL